MKYTPNKDILYEIIGALNEARLPIIFKGANVTNVILKENDSPYIRRTTDIDSSWYGENPTTNNIELMLSDALKPCGYEVVKIRELDGKIKSAGFKILKDGLPVTKIDIDIHKVINSEKYFYGSIEFVGVSFEEILADKFCAISQKSIYRRIKDLIDIYSLLTIYTPLVKDLYKIILESEKNLGNFDELLRNFDLLKKCYNDLKMENKTEFREVYECIINWANKFNDLNCDKL